MEEKTNSVIVIYDTQPNQWHLHTFILHILKPGKSILYTNGLILSDISIGDVDNMLPLKNVTTVIVTLNLTEGVH